MTKLTRYRRPLNLMRDWRDRLFDLTGEDETNFTPDLFTGQWAPSVNISESDGSYHLTAEIPGMKEDDIQVRVDDHSVTLSGAKKDEEEKDEGDYYRYERMFGSFRRSFALPNAIDSDNVEAKYSNGVLDISLPKCEEKSSKKIELKKE